ncbi:unnamed protein product [Litomosoides sigmodontis]|uniref:Uncharacterized protein n=1 Tax=Litomosoides sigmodontis TaxID=42156 RepID=A0A3P6UZL3_LITSI|nr:unnamed protein product [Litomosoides sigmodontis]
MQRKVENELHREWNGGCVYVRLLSDSSAFINLPLHSCCSSSSKLLAMEGRRQNGTGKATAQRRLSSNVEDWRIDTDAQACAENGRFGCGAAF